MPYQDPWPFGDSGSSQDAGPSPIPPQNTTPVPPGNGLGAGLRPPGQQNGVMPPPTKENLQRFTIQESLKAGVDPALSLATFSNESRFNPNALSPKGAQGVTQLMPATSRALGVNAADPYDNIRGGIKYLNTQLDRFGNVEDALRGYNAGPERVAQSHGFKETNDYVNTISAARDKYALDLGPLLSGFNSNALPLPGQQGRPQTPPADQSGAAPDVAPAQGTPLPSKVATMAQPDQMGAQAKSAVEPVASAGPVTSNAGPPVPGAPIEQAPHAAGPIPTNMPGPPTPPGGQLGTPAEPTDRDGIIGRLNQLNAAAKQLKPGEMAARLYQSQLQPEIDRLQAKLKDFPPEKQNGKMVRTADGQPPPPDLSDWQSPSGKAALPGAVPKVTGLDYSTVPGLMPLKPGQRPYDGFNSHPDPDRNLIRESEVPQIAKDRFGGDEKAAREWLTTVHEQPQPGMLPPKPFKIVPDGTKPSEGEGFAFPSAPSIMQQGGLSKDIQEELAYSDWYQARASQNPRAMDNAAQQYLTHYPDGKYASVVQPSKRLFEPGVHVVTKGDPMELSHVQARLNFLNNLAADGPITDSTKAEIAQLQSRERFLAPKFIDRATGQEIPNPGAGASVSVADIEAMRAKGIKDDEIIKQVQNQVASQMGMSPEDVEFLTQKYGGKHPVGDLLVDERKPIPVKESVDRMIESGTANGGLYQIRVPPQVIAQILQDKPDTNPAMLGGQVKFGGHEFLQQLASSEVKYPGDLEARGMARVLLANPKAEKVLDEAGNGLLDAGAASMQMLRNLGEYAQHPLKRLDEAMSDLLTGGYLEEKNPATGKDRFTPMPESEFARRMEEAADPDDKSTVRSGVGGVLKMLPFMMAAEMGGLGVQALGLGEEGMAAGAFSSSPDAALKYGADIGSIQARLGASAGTGAIGAESLIEHAHEPGAAKEALTQTALFASLANAPIGSVVGKLIAGKIGVTPEMTELATEMGAKQEEVLNRFKGAQALAKDLSTASTERIAAEKVVQRAWKTLPYELRAANKEAIDAATGVLQKQLMRGIAGITAEKATNMAQFLVTNEAISATVTGRKMTSGELVNQAVMLLAMEAAPMMREAANLKGEYGGAKEALKAGEPGYPGRTAQPAAPTGHQLMPAFPYEATRNGQPVTVTGDMGVQNGQRYVNIEGSKTGVPLSEVRLAGQPAGLAVPDLESLKRGDVRAWRVPLDSPEPTRNSLAKEGLIKTELRGGELAGQIVVHPKTVSSGDIRAAYKGGTLDSDYLKPKPAEPTPVPEKPETLNAQVDALKAGRKDAVLVTPGAETPEVPKGFQTTETKSGTVIHGPGIKPEDVQKAAEDGTLGEKYLNMVAPRPAPGEPASTVVARDKTGTELGAAVVPPEKVDQQTAEFQKTHPEATIAEEHPAKVLADRIGVPAPDEATLEAENALKEKVMRGDPLTPEEQKVADAASTRLMALMRLSPEDAAQLPEREWQKWTRPRSPERVLGDKNVAALEEAHKASLLRGDIEGAQNLRNRVEYLATKDEDGNPLPDNERANSRTAAAINRMMSAEKGWIVDDIDDADEPIKTAAAKPAEAEKPSQPGLRPSAEALAPLTPQERAREQELQALEWLGEASPADRAELETLHRRQRAQPEEPYEEFRARANAESELQLTGARLELARRLRQVWEDTPHHMAATRNALRSGANRDLAMMMIGAARSVDEFSQLRDHFFPNPDLPVLDYLNNYWRTERADRAVSSQSRVHPEATIAEEHPAKVLADRLGVPVPAEAEKPSQPGLRPSAEALAPLTPQERARQQELEALVRLGEASPADRVELGSLNRRARAQREETDEEFRARSKAESEVQLTGAPLKEARRSRQVWEDTYHHMAATRNALRSGANLDLAMMMIGAARSVDEFNQLREQFFPNAELPVSQYLNNYWRTERADRAVSSQSRVHPEATIAEEHPAKVLADRLGVPVPAEAEKPPQPVTAESKAVQPGVSKDTQVVVAKAARRFTDNPDSIAESYLAEHGSKTHGLALTISGMRPIVAPETRTVAGLTAHGGPVTKIAQAALDHTYTQALKIPQYKRVVFLFGVAAAGKSTASVKLLNNPDVLIVETHGEDPHKLADQFQEAIDAGKAPSGVAVLRDPGPAMRSIIERYKGEGEDRTQAGKLVNASYGADTAVDSAKGFNAVKGEFGNKYPFSIIDNRGKDMDAPRPGPADMPEVNWNIAHAAMQDEIDHALAEGRLTPDEHRQFTGETGAGGANRTPAEKKVQAAQKEAKGTGQTAERVKETGRGISGEEGQAAPSPQRKETLATGGKETTPTVPTGEPGRVGAPVTEVDKLAHEAAVSPTNDRPEPTPAQIEANNAKLGHPRIGGLNVSIENPAGTVRPGRTNALHDHYGYVRGYKGADKEHIDAFVKPGTPTDYDGPAFAVNQNDKSGKFDEVKLMLGYGSEAEARAAYLSNYENAEPNRIGGIASFKDMDALKDWLDNGNLENRAPDRRAAPTEGPRERRQPGNAALRKDIETMDLAESHEAIKHLREAHEASEREREASELARLTDPLTGVLNKQAYEEDEEARNAPIQTMVDGDGLGYLNALLGHDGADEVIKAMALALRTQFSKVYHRSGDEFLVPLQSEANLAKFEKANAILQTEEFPYTLPDGTTERVSGVTFTFGHGATLNEADRNLDAAKREKQQQGLRAAKEQRPPGLSRTSEIEGRGEGDEVGASKSVQEGHGEERPAPRGGQPAEPEPTAATTGPRSEPVTTTSGRGPESTTPAKGEGATEPRFKPGDAVTAKDFNAGKPLTVKGIEGDKIQLTRENGKTISIGVDSAVAKRLKAVEAAPSKKEGITSREDVAKKFEQNWGLKPDVAQTTADLYDARAKAWSEVSGLPVEDWYKSRIADIVAGPPEGESVSQTARAASKFLGDGRAVLHAIKADASSPVHEMGHIMLEELVADSKTNTPQGKQAKKLLAWVAPDLGVKDDNWDRSTEDGRRVHENFASGYEAYNREGKAPTPALQALFDKFRQWLREIYKRISSIRVDGKPIELTDKMRSAYAEMLGGEALPEPKPVESKAEQPDLFGERETEPPSKVEAKGKQNEAEALGLADQSKPEPPSEGEKPKTGDLVYRLRAQPMYSAGQGKRGEPSLEVGKVADNGSVHEVVGDGRQPFPLTAKDGTPQWFKPGQKGAPAISKGTLADFKRGTAHLATQNADEAVAAHNEILSSLGQKPGTETKAPPTKTTEPVTKGSDELLKAIKGGGPAEPTSPELSKNVRPTVTRTSPAKGTPEREALEARYKKTEDAWVELNAKRSDLTDMISRAGYSNKRDTLMKQRDAVDKKMDAIKAEHSEVQGLIRHAGREDILETGDEAQRIAAQGKIDADAGRKAEYGQTPYDRIKALGEVEARNQGIPEEHVQDAAVQAASMMTSYPQMRTLRDQIQLEGIRINKVLRDNALEKALDALTELEPGERRSIRRQMSDYDASRDEQELSAAQEVNARRLQAKAEAAKAEQTATAQRVERAKELIAQQPDMEMVKQGNKLRKTARTALLSAEPDGTFSSLGKDADYLRAKGLMEVNSRKLTKNGQKMAQAMQLDAERMKAGVPFSEYQPGSGKIDVPEKGWFGAEDGGATWYSNGHFMLKGDESIGENRFNKGVSNIITDARESVGHPIKPVLVQGGTEGGPESIYFDNGTRVNSLYYDYVLSKYPDAIFHAADKETPQDSKVTLVSKGEMVGMVMPMRQDRAGLPPSFELVNKPGSGQTLYQSGNEPRQVDSPEFKKWSKGTPLIEDPVNHEFKTGDAAVVKVYHGTRADFDRFEPEREGTNSNVFGSWQTKRSGIFLAESPEFANEFATQGEERDGSNILPVYARVTNLLDLRNGFDDATLNGLEEQGLNTRFYLNLYPHQIWEAFDHESGGKEFVAALQALGHDGTLITDTSEGEDTHTATWVVFKPSQIKSAVGNRGTFDKDNPNILYQEGNEKPLSEPATAYIDGMSVSELQRAANAKWAGSETYVAYAAERLKELGIEVEKPKIDLRDKGREGRYITRQLNAGKIDAAEADRRRDALEKKYAPLVEKKANQQSLVDFVISKGGIKRAGENLEGELRDIGAGVNRPGFINDKTGLTPSKMAEAAQQNDDYKMPDGSKIDDENDLVELLDREARGQDVFSEAKDWGDELEASFQDHQTEGMDENTLEQYQLLVHLNNDDPEWIKAAKSISAQTEPTADQIARFREVSTEKGLDNETIEAEINRGIEYRAMVTGTEGTADHGVTNESVKGVGAGQESRGEAAPAEPQSRGNAVRDEPASAKPEASNGAGEQAGVVIPRKPGAEKIDTDKLWNFKRSDFANPETAESFANLLANDVLEHGDEYKKPVTFAQHMLESGEEISADDVKNFDRNHLVASRRVFLMAAQMTQSLTRQAVDIRKQLFEGVNENGDPLVREDREELQRKAAALEHDAAELAGRTSGARSEYGRDLAMLRMTKPDTLDTEWFINRARNLAEKNGFDLSGKKWQKTQAEITRLASELQARDVMVQKAKRYIDDLQNGKERAKSPVKQTWQEKAVSTINDLEKAARARLAKLIPAKKEPPPNVLYQDGNTLDPVPDLAVVMAAKIAGNKGSLEDWHKQMADEFGDHYANNQDQVLRQGWDLYQSTRRQARMEALKSKDPNEVSTARQEIASWVKSTQRAERAAIADHERIKSQTAKAWDAYEAKGQEERQTAAERAKAGLAEKSEREATRTAATTEKAFQGAEKAKGKAPTGEEVTELLARIDAADRAADERDRYDAWSKDATELRNAAKLAEQDRLREVAAQARAQAKQARVDAAEAQKAQARADRDRRVDQAKKDREARDWNAGLKANGAAAEVKLTDPNYEPTVDDLVAIGAGKHSQGMPPGQWVREMEAIRGYEDNEREVRDKSGQMVRDAKAAAAQARVEKSATKGQAAAYTPEQLDEAVADHKSQLKARNALQRQLSQQFGKLRQGWLDRVNGLIKAGMLSSLLRQVHKIAVGHVGYLAMEEAAKIPAEIVDRVLGAKTGYHAVAPLHTSEMVGAAVFAARRGVAEALDIIKRGVPDDKGDIFSKFAKADSPFDMREVYTGSKAIDTYANTVARAHGAVYHFLKLYALHRALMAEAELEAGRIADRQMASGKLKQGDRTAFIERQKQTLFQKPTRNMVDRAIHAAEVSTLINENAITKAWQSVRGTTGPVGRFILDRQVPFPRVPANIVARTLEATPAGFVIGGVRATRAAFSDKGWTEEDQAKFAHTMGMAFVGTMIMVLGAILHRYGMLDGLVSEDRDKGGRLKLHGKSFVLGGLAPVGTLMIMGASFDQILKGEFTHGSKAAYQMASGMIDEQPQIRGMGGLGDVLTAVKEGDQGVFQRWAGGQLGQVVPSAVSDAAGQIDPFQRQHRTAFDYFKGRIPIWRQTLQPREDVEGNPVKEVNTAFDPYQTRNTNEKIINATTAERLLRELSIEHMPKNTPYDPDKSEARKQILTAMRTGQPLSDDLRAKLKAMPSGVQKALEREGKQTYLQAGFSHLELPDALTVWGVATPSEKQDLSVEMVHKIANAKSKGNVTDDIKPQVAAIEKVIRPAQSVPNTVP